MNTLLQTLLGTYISSTFLFGFYKSTKMKDNTLLDHIILGMWQSNPFYFIMNKEIEKKLKKKKDN